MEKALLEEHVRYGEARFKDKKLVRPFVNRIYQDLAELEALQSRSCEGCKYLDKGKYGICPIAEPLMLQWLNYDEDTFCCNRYIPKEQ